MNNDGFCGTCTQSSLFPIDSIFNEQSLELSLSNIETDDVLMVFLGVSFYNVVAGYPVSLTSPYQNALDVISVFQKPNEANS